MTDETTALPADHEISLLDPDTEHAVRAFLVSRQKLDDGARNGLLKKQPHTVALHTRAAACSAHRHAL